MTSGNGNARADGRTSAPVHSDPVRQTSAAHRSTVDDDGVSLGAELEQRIGVEPLDALLDRRTTLVNKLAPMFALYGTGGVAESQLSAERCRIVGLLRAMAAAKEEKITEAALEAGSRAHPDYLNLIAQQTTERAEFFRLNEELHTIDFRINRGQALIKAWASEART